MKLLKRIIRTLVNVVGVLAAVCLVARLAFVTPFIIPSRSMAPTLEVGDRIIGEHVTRDYEVGDIVTFTNPEDPDTTLIKRIVAVEGETVDLRNGKLYVNGEIRDIDGAHGKSYPFEEHADNLDENVTFPLTVPEGCVFVMGDNREDSADSRYFGCINTSRITSEIIWRMSPIDRIGIIE